MIKDILVNLSPGDARDPAADYAISLAGLTQAHLAGIAFGHGGMFSALRPKASRLREAIDRLR